MNNSFGRGFNSGFRSNFYSKSKFNFSTFFKNANKNKNIFNMFNSKINSPIFKINFSNKYFIGKVYLMSNTLNASGKNIFGSKMLSGDHKLTSDADYKELDLNSLILSDNIMLNGFFVVKSGKKIY